MKKLNFLAKTFSLLLVLMLSAHFGELNAQSFITESQAEVKLSTKLDQLSKTPNTSLTFPNGKKVTGDDNNVIRTQYYTMILQNLQAKDQAGNPTGTTKGAYEALKLSLTKGGQTNAPTPETTTTVGLSWLRQRGTSVPYSLSKIFFFNQNFNIQSHGKF
jgi:hypothetical protein